MDRSLDEIINSRDVPRGGGQRGRGPRNNNNNNPSRGPRRDERAPRRDDFPRDGVKKSYAREDPRDIDNDWVHDKFDDDDSRRPQRGPRNDRYRNSPPPAHAGQTAETKTIRAENLHYDLTKKDLSDLFGRIGDLESVRILYDRNDRSQGIAFITYVHAEDAPVAVRQYDGANAIGQPIRLSLAPGPSTKPTRNPLDSIVKPARSLFERIGPVDDKSRGGRRGRSASPQSRPSRPDVDRYVPGGGRDRRASRSPMRRRGTPRETGRRPGARREESGRGGRGGRGGNRGGRGDGEGRAAAQGRPKKTAEELDAEMDNYWGGAGGSAADTQTQTGREPQVETVAYGQNNTMAATSTINADDDIDLMVE